VRARIWGCRGSLAAPGPETVRYGGNTSCIEVRPSDDRLIILDAGTGIRSLGISLGADRPDRIDIFLSHLHLDHIEGLGFFTPIWDPNCEVHIWGPPSPQQSLKERVGTYFSPPLFPVHLHDIPARLEFHDVSESEWDLGPLRIRAQHITHPGPTLGYRLEEETTGRSISYLSDHEPALNLDLASMPAHRVSGYDLAQGTDVLFHDSQYTEEEYPHRVGWGHSSISDMVTFGLITKVRRLVMFHHDPLHSDAQLEAMLVRARELWGDDPNGSLVLAFEGMRLDLEAEADQPQPLRSLFEPD
jgi:phosphoribosyl 1,2-cyclic phosphodiesterase